MSKYDSLKQWLLDARGDRTPLTFFELETLLEFPLPASARTHRPWWANTASGHSHASAWLDAGWRTADVDLARERLVFERKPVSRSGDGKVQAASAAAGREGLLIARVLLSADAQRLIDDLARTTAGDTAAAAAALLNQLALERRLQQALASAEGPARSGPGDGQEAAAEPASSPPRRLEVVAGSAPRRA